MWLHKSSFSQSLLTPSKKYYCRNFLNFTHSLTEIFLCKIFCAQIFLHKSKILLIPVWKYSCGKFSAQKYFCTNPNFLLTLLRRRFQQSGKRGCSAQKCSCTNPFSQISLSLIQKYSYAKTCINFTSLLTLLRHRFQQSDKRGELHRQSNAPQLQTACQRSTWKGNLHRSAELRLSPMLDSSCPSDSHGWE